MLKLHLTYKNGNTLDESVNYLASDSKYLIYTVRTNPTPVFSTPVRIPLKNLASWELEEIDG